MVIPTKGNGELAVGRWELLVLQIGRAWWWLTGWLTLPFLISAFYVIAVPLLIVADFTTPPDRNLGLRFLANEGLFGIIVIPKWFIYGSFIIAGLAVRQNINVVWLTMTLFPMLLYGLGLLSLAMTGSAGGALVTIYLIFGGLAGIIGLRTRWEVSIANIEYLNLRRDTQAIRNELHDLKRWRNVLHETINSVSTALDEIEQQDIEQAVTRLTGVTTAIKQSGVTGATNGTINTSHSTDTDTNIKSESVTNPVRSPDGQ